MKCLNFVNDWWTAGLKAMYIQNKIHFVKIKQDTSPVSRGNTYCNRKTDNGYSYSSKCTS